MLFNVEKNFVVMEDLPDEINGVVDVEHMLKGGPEIELDFDFVLEIVPDQEREEAITGVELLDGKFLFLLGHDSDDVFVDFVGTQDLLMQSFVGFVLIEDFLLAPQFFILF